jgi:hypothetical protein
VKDIVSAIQGTPIPTLMILGGILFLLLGISGGFAGKIVVTQQRQNLTLVIGTGLLLVGLSLYFFRRSASEESPKTASTATPASNADVPIAQTSAAPPTSSLPSTSQPSASESEEIIQAKSWPLVLRDTFQDNKNGWYVGDFDYKEKCNFHAKDSMGEGLFRMEIQFMNNCISTLEAPNLTVADFYLAIETRMTTFAFGSDQYAASGVFFRSAHDDMYEFYVSSVNTYELILSDKGTFKTLIPWTPSPFIKGSSANRIGIIAHGERISLYINDHWVADTSDVTSTAGRVGFVTQGWGKDTRVVVDAINFELRRKP